MLTKEAWPWSLAMTRSGIPDDVADAFGEAVVLLVQWQGGVDEPVALLDGKTMPISMIFELVASRACRDEVPRSMLKLCVRTPRETLNVRRKSPRWRSFQPTRLRHGVC
jgi:hypothetical protein